MSSSEHRDGTPLRHGQLVYLQLPARDLAESAAFYASVLGWSVEPERGDFVAPGIIGQWSTELTATGPDGPVVWACVEDLGPTLGRVTAAGGTVTAPPQLDGGDRWLVLVDDPAGNRVGLVAPVHTARPQTLLAVVDVEASSRWYQELLGLTSDHGGPEYERLLADGDLVLQLHQRDVPHHHGPIGGSAGDAGSAASADGADGSGHGVLVWFGEVSDFDGVVQRVADLGARVVREPHRNPPSGQGNGPGHREIWVLDPDGYTVVVASPDGEAFEVDPA